MKNLVDYIKESHINESLTFGKNLGKAVAAVVNDFTEVDNGYKEAVVSYKEDDTIYVDSVNENPGKHPNIFVTIFKGRGYLCEMIVTMTDRDRKADMSKGKGGVGDTFIIRNEESGKLEGKLWDYLEKLQEEYSKI